MQKRDVEQQEEVVESVVNETVNENVEDVQEKTVDSRDELIAKLTQENAVLNDKILRLSAEMQNMRRRYDEQISNMLKYDGENIVKEFLAIIDNLDRAVNIDESKLSDELSKFLSGFKMINGNLVNILNKYEISEIDCVNKAFDPNTMDAVLTDSVEGMEKGLVIEVLQKGYMYKDKVIRHAMVKVNN